jgi:exodeoxyribonuclease V alpha subunit
MMSVIPELLGMGITINLAIKIFKKYGQQTVERIHENPYQLIYDIEGIGFLKSDDIAKKIGFDLTSIERCRGGVYYIMSMDAEDGNTYMLKDNLIKKCIELMNVDSVKLNMAIFQMVEDGIIIHEDGKYFLSVYYKAEKLIADRLQIMSRIFVPSPNIEQTIEEIEREYNIEYEYEQKEAIKTALSSNVMILTGGPGTGKTTVTRGIIYALEKMGLKVKCAAPTGKTTVTRGIIYALEKMGLKVKCAAPTGKAADRMSEATGHFSETIHRLLEYNPEFGYAKCEESPINADVVIIDEMSMVNVLLMKNLIRALQYKTKFILIGDIDQLPCIGAGNILKDIIRSNKIPVINLVKIFRQAQESKIVTTAHSINKSIMSDLTNKITDDLFFMKLYNEEIIGNTVIDLVTNRLPKKYNVRPSDIQVLTPMKITSLGSEVLNEKLQFIINPIGDYIQYGNTIFRMGDKVMQIKNNYDNGVFNGDTGYITDVNTEDKTISVTFKNNTILYQKTELDELMLAYSCTIHKSQGSEYDIVVIPIFRSQKRMLQRNLLYTAITRAKKLCILVGDDKMFEYAVNNIEVDNRLTSLKDFLLK